MPIVKLLDQEYDDSITKLYYRKNIIPKEIGNLINLQIFNFSYNKITEIPIEIGNLFNLQEFYCHNNCQITEIPREIGNLINLQFFNCSNNKITEIPREIRNLINLQYINCCYNKITEIPREIGKLINLQQFYCYDNQITEIPREIGNLINLRKFFCSNNKITEIPREIGNLINLQTFNCYNNQITEIPREIYNCRNLRYFEYSNNEIEHIPPDITRFLNRLHNGQNIYLDTQSVHNHNIQTCIKTSIQNIMNYKPIIINYLEYIMQDTIFTELTKQSLIEYSNYEDIHTELNITFKELLIYVINRIEINPHKDEIKKILNDEIKDSLCKCFTGRISRLINCLNGFDPEVNITISDNEQISQIIILTRELLSKDYTVEKHKELTIKELKERGYSDDIIKEWIDFIE